MKLSISPAEHDAMDALDEESFNKLFRDSLAAHRASGASDDETETTTSGVVGGPKNGAKLQVVYAGGGNGANDSARAIHRARALDPRLSAADRAQARILANDYADEAARDKAMAKIIPGLDRL